jgi:hypothetical protein
MTIANVQDLVDCELNGNTWWATWRKVPTQATVAGNWFDLSMSPGNPLPNYYAASPGISVALSQSTDGGIPHGSSVNSLGYKKYLKTFCAMTQTATAVPLPMILCDYLMFYSFMDMSNSGWNPVTTSQTLPRYTTGDGVEMMAVIVAQPTGVGNPRFQVQYTNSQGVSGRLTKWISTGTQTLNGTIANTIPATAGGAGPFIPLAFGDKGVRSIDAVNFIDSDYGLLAFVLCVPLENTNIRTIDAPVERNSLVDFAKMAEIKDDAYLNIICYPNGSLQNATIQGYIQTVWG